MKTLLGRNQTMRLWPCIRIPIFDGSQLSSSLPCDCSHEYILTFQWLTAYKSYEHANEYAEDCGCVELSMNNIYSSHKK